MNNENKPEGFSYTYSAKQMEEVKRIREKYEAKAAEEDAMEKLRRLDAGVTRKGTAASLILGVLGTLIMGTGMSIAMTELGDVFGTMAMPLGIATGVLGIVLLTLAYPVYTHLVKKEHEKIAPEIMRLTDELLK